jgi:hypothetical protein
MNYIGWLSGLTMVLGGAVLAQASGCIVQVNFDDCSVFPHAGCGSGGGTTTSSSTNTGGGGDGGGGGPPANCDPKADPTVAVDPLCGVFVSITGKDAADGTQGAPVQTLAHALDLAKGKPIYACAGATPFKESLVVPAGTVIYGGVDCTSWKYVGDQKQTQLNGDDGKIALTLQMGASATELFDMYVMAGAASGPGASSIAAVVDKATATFTRCTLVAQDAGEGDPGVSGGDQAAQATGGTKGDDAGLSGALGGGAGGPNPACSLQGGNGGNGGAIMNGDGGDGTQGDTNQGGAKGTGQTAMNACSNGANGDIGASMPFGTPIQGPGTIDTKGYHGVDGKPGTDGTNGTSGGGGGGSKATMTAHGAGGGGGGAGGCGGKHGEAGKAGGSSIALLSLSAKVKLTECKLVTGKGGKGGDGGDGQFGQLGGKAGDSGTGAAGAVDGCNGGKGGSGGNGGNGSGGLGGHSLGIALTGTKPTLDDATKSSLLPGAPGPGGLGGRMDADMNHGPDGNAGACWDFAKNTACTP